jgi:hypothetical protein
MFFELRQYRTKPGQRDQWVRFMEEEVIPFLISKGMVVIGSFVAEEEEDLYVWVRRFESGEQREALSSEVHDSEFWRDVIAPQVREMLDTERISVTRLAATPKSVIQ